MPGQDRLGLNDGQRRAPAPPRPGQPDPEDAVPGVNLRRFLAERCNTPIWWRSARFSSWRAERERKTEDKVAKSVVTERNIGEENYERSILPVRSDI
jgi:hypothetical protein